MATVSRDLATIASATVDRDLVAEFLAARSQAHAELAYLSLDRDLDSASMLALANLRELFQDLPTTPLHSGCDINILARTLGYQTTGYSYRLQFDSEAGEPFAIEFVGANNQIELIVLHTVYRRLTLSGDSEFTILPEVVEMLLTHPAVAERLLEALHELGIAVSPRFYLRPEEFAIENAAGAAEDLGDLF